MECAGCSVQCVGCMVGAYFTNYNYCDCLLRWHLTIIIIIIIIIIIVVVSFVHADNSISNVRRHGCQ